MTIKHALLLASGLLGKGSGGGGGGGANILPHIDITQNGNYDVTEFGYDGVATATVSVPAPTLVPKLINDNGVYNPADDSADGYSGVVVDVAEPDLMQKTITQNGVYMAADDSVDGYEQVTVEVPTPAAPVLTNKTITANGTYDPANDNADGYGTVIVNVQGSGGTSHENEILSGTLSGRYENKTVTGLKRWALEGQNGVTSLYMPALLDFAPRCFWNMTGLTHAVFPSVVCAGRSNTVGGTFEGCTNLQAVDLGEDLSFFGGTDQFYRCTNLSVLVIRKKDAVIPMNQPPTSVFGSSGFYHYDSTSGKYVGSGTVYVPFDVFDDYQTNTNWCALMDYGVTIEPIEGSEYEYNYVDGTPIPQE